MPSDGASTPLNDRPNEPAPDPYAAGGYGSQPHESGPYPGNYPDHQYGTPSYGSQSSGAQSYDAQQPYGGQPYGAQSYGQPYGGQSYGAQSYGQPYGAQPFGAQPYGAVQPYGQASQAARKDPALMLVASLIIPGLGTILNGETGKGVGILAGYIVGALLTVVLIGLPIMFGFWIWGMIDAYNGAKSHNARHGLP